MPIRLGKYRNVITIIFQQPTNQRNAERRVVNIRIACNENHVKPVPTSQAALFRRCR
jgi:hypothetical protein